MAQTPAKPVKENIIDANYTEVMSKSYIDYSMSVLTARALPDVRDGLKPVQRRILYDMDRLKTTHDKPYRKSARIVGDTMGKYHPHGDSSIYDAMVVMARDFKMGLPLVDGHGNFGSIEGDGQAASRYTEARLRQVTEEAFLEDLDRGIVPFQPNFDETEKEPVVLPARIPNLLVNGSEGIAVGMTTNIPPHNLSECIDAAVALIKNNNLTTKDLMKYIKGPDFPTGGIVINASELPEIYETGLGKIRIRGKVETEPVKGGKTNLVVTEIPYTMIGQEIGKFMQDTAKLADERGSDITDISNQNGKEGMRLVVELKKDADPAKTEALLYKKTKLENTFGYNAIALSEGKPETLSLKKILTSFVDFQFEITGNKYESLLNEARSRSEIEEGLIRAVDVIDLIIEILRGCKTTAQAKACLVSGDVTGIKFKTKKSESAASKLSFTERQAQAILDMRLQKLIGLEIDALQKAHDKTLAEIKTCEKILGDYNEMANVIIKDLQSLKKYGHPRKTVITDAKAVVVEEEKKEAEPLVFLMDKFGYARTIDQTTFEKNRDAAISENKLIIPVMSDRKLWVFTEEGMMHSVKAEDVPFGKFRAKGTPLDLVCNYDSKQETRLAVLPDTVENIVFVTEKGFVKVVGAEEFNTRQKTIKATKLSTGDKLVIAAGIDAFDEILLRTDKDKFLRFPIIDIPKNGRTAVGAIGLKLAKTEKVAGAYVLPYGANAVIEDEGFTLDTKLIPSRKRAGTPKAVPPTQMKL